MSSDPVSAALVRRMRTSDAISEDDIATIHALAITVKDYPAERAIMRDGERATECCLIVEGFGIRSKTLSEGKRQILSIHIPGEIPDLMSLFLHVMDHDLSTLTPCRLGFISHEALRQLHRRRPNVAEMFWRDTLIDAAMFREWIVNVGQRPAPARLAHVMAELRERLRVIGRVEGNSFEMPLTQEQIGEALGITGVHANRSSGNCGRAASSTCTAAGSRCSTSSGFWNSPTSTIVTCTYRQRSDQSAITWKRMGRLQAQARPKAGTASSSFLVRTEDRFRVPTARDRLRESGRRSRCRARLASLSTRSAVCRMT